jgi:hypothetical protein
VALDPSADCRHSSMQFQCDKVKLTPFMANSEQLSVRVSAERAAMLNVLVAEQELWSSAALNRQVIASAAAQSRQARWSRMSEWSSGVRVNQARNKALLLREFVLRSVQW